tara:strand:- start:48 stop:1523 length:1476 start_codon:yes stop_codon:yes gene_type:complete
MKSKLGTSQWFDVDKKGLSQLMADRSAGYVLAELIQNAWDQNITQVECFISPAKTRGWHTVEVVDDDPAGWADISDAYTLFAPSRKKSDPEKRGRFNLGEKLVLSVCQDAEIVTVNSAVKFTARGRQAMKARRDVGSSFKGTMKLTKADVKVFKDIFNALLLPDGLKTTATIEGEQMVLEPHIFVRDFRSSLPTVICDESGSMKRTTRQTTVQLFEVLDGEKPTIYEMGIPVVSWENKYHINVMQKIPLNMDRDNVTPAFMSQLLVETLNSTHDLLEDDDFKETWVTQASDDERCEGQATEKMLTARFGEKRVAYDPSNPEANKLAASRGYTVVTGGSLPKQVWANAKAAEAILPSSVLTPTSNDLFQNQFDPNGAEMSLLDPSDYTDDIKAVVALAERLHGVFFDTPCSVTICNDNNVKHAVAWYSQNAVTLHLIRLSHRWFAEDNLQDQIDLMLHEFGHRYESDHLSENYYNALTKLGAKLAVSLGMKR